MDSLINEGDEDDEEMEVFMSFENRISDLPDYKILPSVEGKDNVPLLMKTMDMWAKYHKLAKCLLRFFEPLRPFCSMNKRTGISDVSYNLFCDWIFQQRAGRASNLDMVKARIDLFVEVDHKGKRYYCRNFEQVLLSHIDTRYANLANEWLLTCSFHEYLKKALNSMYIEERRMGHYLPRNTMANVVEILPSVEGKDNVPLLMKTMDMWVKYQKLAHWLLRFFAPLRPLCSMNKRMDISDVPYNLFCDWIFQQRAGRAINLDMIKAGIDLFVEVDHKGKRYYCRNFELVLLSHIDTRYAKLANEWLLTCSFHEYHKKALNCMYIEERRMGHYLPQNTMANVVEILPSVEGKDNVPLLMKTMDMWAKYQKLWHTGF